MVLYQICVFGVDRKFNMAARANNKKLHRKLKIGQHEPHYKLVVNSGAL
jgi:hypothetical protein